MQESFEGLAAVGGWTFRLRTEAGEPARRAGQRVTWEFFPALRVAPLLGRSFTADDEIEGRHRVAILSYGFWQRRFGGAPRRRRQDDGLSEETLGDHRRAAARLRLPGLERSARRDLRADRVPHRREDARRQPELQLDRDRPPEARRHDRAGARADEPRRGRARRAVPEVEPGPARARRQPASPSGRPGAAVDADAARRGRRSCCSSPAPTSPT